MKTTDRILNALAGPRILATDELREALGSPADFDAAAFQLEDEARIILSKDCDPASIPADRLPRLLREGRHVYTTAMIR